MSDHYQILDRKETSDTTIEVLQYEKLLGSSDARSAERLFFVQQVNMRLKMVRIRLRNAKVRIEPGALYYMEGNLEMTTSTGGGLMAGLKRAALSGESLFVNEIKGTGDIYLEPTFGHFILVDIEDDEMICDKSLFYAGTSSLDISAVAQKNISSALFGGEGFFQTSIKGKGKEKGIAVLFSPVPFEELQQFDLQNSKLSVDGNFTLMRTKGIDFRAEKSSKSWAATSVSGEGLLQTFSGTGSVWIAPTQNIYEKLTTDAGLRSLAGAVGDRAFEKGKGK